MNSLLGAEEAASHARKLHKRLHTHRTCDEEQVDLNENAPTCGAFAEPSDGLEPSTPSLPSQTQPELTVMWLLPGRKRYGYS